jgi:hypothetical protein
MNTPLSAGQISYETVATKIISVGRTNPVSCERPKGLHFSASTQTLGAKTALEERNNMAPREWAHFIGEEQYREFYC